MQPNEQQQYSQNNQPSSNGYISPTGAYIPDYLKMEPVQEKKNNGFKKVIIFILILTSLLVAGIIVYITLQQNSMQEKFYSMLDNQLRIKYVEREVNLETVSGSSQTNVSSDLSNPSQVKSEITMSLSDADKNTTKLKSVVLDDLHYMYSIEEAPRVALGDIQQGQWYRKSFNASNRSEVTYTIDSDPSPLILNSSQAIIPFGNFIDSQREQIVNFIKQNNVYEIISFEAKEEDGVAYIVYTLKLNEEKINALNKELAGLLGSKRVYVLSEVNRNYENFTVWVNKESEMLHELSYISGDGKESINTRQTTTFSYPGELQINTPSNVKEHQL